MKIKYKTNLSFLSNHSGASLIDTIVGVNHYSSLTSCFSVLGTTGRNIRNLPCISRKTNQSGVCMFAIDCLKANGTHLGTCIDRFYFGSCCHIEPHHQDVIDNNIDLAIIPPREPPLRVTNTTTAKPVTTTKLSTTTVKKKVTVAATTEIPFKITTFQSVQNVSTLTVQNKTSNTEKPTKKPITTPAVKPAVTKPKPTRPTTKPVKFTKPTPSRTTTRPFRITTKPTKTTTTRRPYSTTTKTRVTTNRFTTIKPFKTTTPATTQTVNITNPAPTEVVASGNPETNEIEAVPVNVETTTKVALVTWAIIDGQNTSKPSK